MKNLTIFLLMLSQHSFGQLKDFNVKRHKTDQRLMLVLGAFATTNLVGSGIGWASASNEEMRFFHQMNVMWNTVNLGLAIPGYLKAKTANNAISFSKTMEQQRKTEFIFLFNGGLDLAYIGAGLIMRNEAKSNFEKANLLKGYGNSLLLQGGFLLIFDWLAYSLHQRHFKNNCLPILKRLELSDNGLGLKLNLGSTTRSYK